MTENIESASAYKRHFNFPCEGLQDLRKEFTLKFLQDGVTYSNTNRDNFPLLKEIKNEEFSDLKNAINNYEDVIFANRHYQQAIEYRKIYCSHIIKHLLRTRAILMKNNDKVSERGDKIDGIRDQGFFRCRVMIIAPTRHSALEIVKCLRSFMPEHKVGKKWTEFVKSYSEQHDSSDDDKSSNSQDDSEEDEKDEEKARGDILMKKINENMKLSATKHYVKKTGIDFDEWLIGNTNEKFVFGISVEKRLFNINTMISNSDIVIGSPISLREIVDDRKNYVNMLTMTSSIEILLMDQVEYMVMQNFDNIYPILEKLNQKPHGSGDCVSKMNSALRTYTWAIDDKAKSYRQNIILSSILHPFIQKFMYYFHNFQGTSVFIPRPQVVNTDILMVDDRLSKREGPKAKKAKTLNNNNVLFERLSFSVLVPSEIKERTFSSCEILDKVKPADSRMSLFKRKVVPLLLNKLNRGGVLIYFTQTNDLYKVQEVLRSENLDVAVISENQEEENIRPIITLFAKGGIKYILLSERFYALTRQRLSAIQHLIYYSTPTFPKFSRDFHEFMLFNSKATAQDPHHVVNLCEDELFEQINSQIAFKHLYGQ